MKIAILTTGDEIMAGNIVDSNAAWISEQCSLLGCEVVLHLSVADDPEAIGEAVLLSQKKANVVFVSGGLGPTVDDLTLEAAAKALNLKMVFHEEIWEGITAFFKKRNRPCTENNKKQAYLPEGASALPNQVGTVPGVLLEHKGVTFFFLPGVPKELKQIFEDSILMWLKSHAKEKGYAEKVFKCFGLPEASFGQMIEDVPLEGVRLSFRCSLPEVIVKLVARSKDPVSAKNAVEKAGQKIQERLQDYIYGEGNDTLEGIVNKLLENKEYSLSIDESCTGGLVASRMTNVPGASKHFERGFVTYSNQSKIYELQVPAETIKKFGAVSPEVALAMAEGVRKVSRTDIGLAVTGIAGPGGGTKEKPVGTVYIAIAGPKGSKVTEYHYPRPRLEFKEIVTATALDMLRRYLNF